jgi:ABC-2 type transport system permease protein
MVLRFLEGRERPARALPLGSWPLRSVFANSLRSLTASTLWWGLVITTYTSLLTALLQQAGQNRADFFKAMFEGNPVYADMIAKFLGGDATINGPSSTGYSRSWPWSLRHSP